MHKSPPTPAIDTIGMPALISLARQDYRVVTFPIWVHRLDIETQATSDHPLVLFDGVCNLCQRSVQFIIRHDSRARFRFAPLQSVVAQRLLGPLEFREQPLSSVLYIEHGQCSRKSRAVLRIAKQLDGAWPVLYYLAAWIPTSIADRLYDWVGARRYQWFGKKSECWVPDDTLRQRFIVDE